MRINKTNTFIKQPLNLQDFGETRVNIHGNLVVSPHNSNRATYPKTIATIIDNIASGHSIQKPLLVGIAGARNATKSTTAESIANLLEKRKKVLLLSMDNYLQPAEFFASQGINTDKQPKDPIGINFEQVVSDILALLRGQVITTQTRDRYQYDYRGPEIKLNGAGADIILVEGMSSLMPCSLIFKGRIFNDYARILSSLFYLKIYLSISTEDAEKAAFLKTDKRLSLGLPAMDRAGVYQRFSEVDLPRFDYHYPLCRANANIVCKLQYLRGAYKLDTLTIDENLLQALRSG